MRLNIAVGRLENAQILSNKIQLKYLNKEGNEGFKEEFYRMKVQLTKDKSFLETARHYYILAKNTTSKEPTNKNKNNDLCLAALNCALAPFDKDQSLFLLTLFNDPLIKECAIY